MKGHLAVYLGFALLCLSTPAWSASDVSTNMTTAMALIANYDEDGGFKGWGSGFFVDEGILVTNKHVIEGGQVYRVYATATDGTVNLDCFKRITRSDVKINLDDDVAYMRVYLSCEHGIVDFATDPETDDALSVLGYPYKGTVADSLRLTVTTGSVIGKSDEGWLRTDAFVDVGSSGGPVINGEYVLGVIVAKGTDKAGNYLAGYFIPSSVIINGLLYANDARFGYVHRGVTSSSRQSSRQSSSVSSSSSSSSSSVARPRSRSSVTSTPPGFQSRTCARVAKWFARDGRMLVRVNVRLLKRFGFECH